MAGNSFAQVKDSIPLIIADSLKAIYIYADTGTAINRTDAQGRKQGLWEKKYPNGRLRYRGHFYNNNPVGVFKYNYDNDSIESIVTYSEKGKVARARIFYENGGVLSMGKFINHKKDSIWVYYDESLRLYKKEQYVNGKKEGKSIVFYANGNVEETVNWHNDIQNGPWQEFFDNGQVKLDATYVNGKREGLLKAYSLGDPDEPVMQGHYIHDDREGKWIYVNRTTGVPDTVIYKHDKIISKNALYTQHNLDSLRMEHQGIQQKLDNPGSLQDQYNTGGGNGGGN